ncbi:MAG: DNA-processing protein DprA [Clostridia bacterium]|nr:DNA-processing protein DprA [Clostridia bacterium]
MKNLESKKYWIWFSLIKNLGCRRKLKLLKIYKNPEIIYKLPKEKLLEVEGIGEDTANNISISKNKKLLEYHINYMMKNNIDIINIQDKEYPQILKEIYDPPISLYIRGNKNILNNTSIGIVGCRQCTEYGEKAAKYFSYNLAKENTNIVSGLAIGIDSYSHIGCLAAEGETIAVIGNGLDMVYPKENIELANKIIKKGGAIISEYPCGTRPDKMNFPARNRIISGISDSIIVIEAKEKSGTLITVDFALEQGRDVFVVPGNINSVNSVGTNNLIKQGARIVVTYKDVLSNL